MQWASASRKLTDAAPALLILVVLLLWPLRFSDWLGWTPCLKHTIHAYALPPLSQLTLSCCCPGCALLLLLVLAHTLHMWNPCSTWCTWCGNVPSYCTQNPPRQARFLRFESMPHCALSHFCRLVGQQLSRLLAKLYGCRWKTTSCALLSSTCKSSPAP